MIHKIADYYGLSSQLRQTQEECNELELAISKYCRDKNNDNIKNIVEELADVEIKVEQIKYLLGCDTKVESVKEFKINRQLKRIYNEEQGLLPGQITLDDLEEAENG